MTLGLRMVRALSRTLLTLENTLTPPPDEDETRALPPVYLGIEEFARCMETAIANTRGRRFIDVGCGIGTKLLLAQYLGFDVYGIELRQECVEVARRFLDPELVTVADAFAIERFDADVVYAHRCCVYDEEQERLERQIADRMPTGALVVLPYGALDPRGWEWLGDQVWRVG